MVFGILRRKSSGRRWISNSGTANVVTVKPFDVLVVSTQEAIGRLKRLWTDRHYRRLEFHNIGSDIRLNCVAGGLIFCLGDILAQLFEARQTSNATKESTPKCQTDSTGSILSSLENMISSRCGGE